MTKHTHGNKVSSKIRKIRKEGIPQKAAVGKALGILKGKKKKR